MKNTALVQKDEFVLICDGKDLDSYPGRVIYRITPKGFEETDSVEDNEIALMTCRRTQTEKGKLHFERCCLDMCDIRNSAQIYIDALYELDRYLGRLRKKDFAT